MKTPRSRTVAEGETTLEPIRGPEVGSLTPRRGKPHELCCRFGAMHPAGRAEDIDQRPELSGRGAAVGAQQQTRAVLRLQLVQEAEHRLNIR